MYLPAESVDKPRRTGIIEIEKGRSRCTVTPYKWLKKITAYFCRVRRLFSFAYLKDQGGKSCEKC